MTNVLGYREKLVLAYSRTVSGTLSLIASFLILNKIYRCCYKKAIRNRSSNTSSSNNTTTATAAAAAAAAAGVPGTGAAIVSHRNHNNNTPSIPEEGVVAVVTAANASENPHQNTPATTSRIGATAASTLDDGFTPLPQQQQQRPHNNNATAAPNDTGTGIQATAVPLSALTTSATSSTNATTAHNRSGTISYKGCWSQWRHIWSYTTVYQRLLIGTSTLDILHSFWAALSTIPVPASSGVVNGFGTVTTCTMQGFFVQSSCATPIYFASLTFYFMCKVCYNTSDETLRRKYYELFFHLLPLLIAFGGGTVGVVLKIFNPIALPELGCWVAPYPIGCARTNTCTRGYKIGQYSDLYAWSLAFIWFFLAFIIVVINTTLIYRAIYNRERYGPTYTRARIIQQQQEHQQRQQNDPNPRNQQQQQQQHTPTALPSSYVSSGSTILTNHSSDMHNKNSYRSTNSSTQSEHLDMNYNSNTNNATNLVSIQEGSDDDGTSNNRNHNYDNDTLNINQVSVYHDEMEQQSQHGDNNNDNNLYSSNNNEINQSIDIDENDDAMQFDTEFIEEEMSLPSTHQNLDNTTTNSPIPIDANITPHTNSQQQQHRYHPSSSRGRGGLRTNNTTLTSMNDNSMITSSNGSSSYRRRQQQHRTSVRTSRIAAVQCVLYVSTALFTAVWSVMPWIGKKLGVTSQWRFFFAFMFNIFNPLQGFFTLIIFIRLQYLRLRISEPNWSRIQCVRYCLFSPDAK